MTQKLTDLSRLCIHTVTTRPWAIEEAAENYAAAGISGITVWTEALEGRNAESMGRMLRNHGLDIVSYVRGGFFADPDGGVRQKKVDETRRIIEEAAALGAPMVVLVAGASPHQGLEESRKQIREGLENVLPDAEEAGVRLGIEPLHPMYADSRSAINTLAQANDLAESLNSDHVGVVIDVYHLWWDPSLKVEIARCGRHGNLFAYHVCDWKSPTEHFLLDRGLMGEGVIPLHKIRGWVEEAGFDGYIEVEIFSENYWKEVSNGYLQKIQSAYQEYA